MQPSPIADTSIPLAPKRRVSSLLDAIVDPVHEKSAPPDGGAETV